MVPPETPSFNNIIYIVFDINRLVKIKLFIKLFSLREGVQGNRRFPEKEGVSGGSARNLGSPDMIIYSVYITILVCDILVAIFDPVPVVFLYLSTMVYRVNIGFDLRERIADIVYKYN